MAKTKKPYVNPETGYVDFTGPVTQGGFSSVTRAGRLDSQYDIATPAWGDINKYRAERQGFAAELGNALASAGTEFALGLLRDAADISDLTTWDDVLFNRSDEKTGELNWLSKIAQQGIDYVNEEMPVYSDGFDRGYFVKGIANTVASAAEFALMGAGVGKLASMGLKYMLNANKVLAANAFAQGVARGAGALTTAGAMTFAEGMLSGKEVYDKVYEEKLFREGATEQEAHEAASNALIGTVRANSVNFLLNLTGAAKAFNAGYKGVTRNLVDDVLKPNKDELFDAAAYAKRLENYKPVSLRNTFKEMAKEAPQEMIEEMVNVGAEAYGKMLAENKQSKDGFNAFIDGMFSKEGFESGFWGAFGGVGQQAVTSGINAISGENKRKESEFKKQLDAIQKSLTEIPTVVKKVSNLNFALKELDREQTDSDIEELKADVIENLASVNFSTGTSDVLVNQYEALMRASTEELLKNNLVPDGSIETVANFKKSVKEALNTTKKLETFYNRSLNINGDLGQSFVDDYYEHSVVANHTIPRAIDRLEQEKREVKKDILEQRRVIAEKYKDSKQLPFNLDVVFEKELAKIDFIDSEINKLQSDRDKALEAMKQMESKEFRNKVKGLQDAVKKAKETKAKTSNNNKTTQREAARQAVNNEVRTEISNKEASESEIDRIAELKANDNFLTLEDFDIYQANKSKIDSLVNKKKEAKNKLTETNKEDESEPETEEQIDKGNEDLFKAFANFNAETDEEGNDIKGFTPPPAASNDLEAPPSQSIEYLADDVVQKLKSKGIPEYDNIFDAAESESEFVLLKEDGGYRFYKPNSTKTNVIEQSVETLNEILSDKSVQDSLDTEVVRIKKVASSKVNSFLKNILKLTGKNIQTITPEEFKFAYLRILAEKVKQSTGAQNPEIIEKAVNELLDDNGIKALYFILVGTAVNSGNNNFVDLADALTLKAGLNARPVVTQKEIKAINNVSELIAALANTKSKNENSSLTDVKLNTGNTLAYKGVESSSEDSRLSVSTDGNPAKSVTLKRVILVDGSIEEIDTNQDAIDTISKLSAKTVIKAKIDPSFQVLLNAENAVETLPIELWADIDGKEVFVGYMHTPNYYNNVTTAEEFILSSIQENIAMRKEAINALRKGEVFTAAVVDKSEGFYEREFKVNESGSKRFVYRPINEISQKANLSGNNSITFGYVNNLGEFVYELNGQIIKQGVPNSETFRVGMPVVVIIENGVATPRFTRLSTFNGLPTEAKQIIAEKFLQAIDSKHPNNKEAMSFIDSILLKGNSRESWFEIKNGTVKFFSPLNITLYKEDLSVETILEKLAELENKFNELAGKNGYSIFSVNSDAFGNAEASKFLSDFIVRTDVRPIKTATKTVFKGQQTITLEQTISVSPSKTTTTTTEQPTETTEKTSEETKDKGITGSVGGRRIRVRSVEDTLENADKSVQEETSEDENQNEETKTSLDDFYNKFTSKERKEIVDFASLSILNLRDSLLNDLKNKDLSKEQIIAKYKEAILSDIQKVIDDYEQALGEFDEESAKVITQGLNTLKASLNFVDVVYLEAKSILEDNNFDDIDDLKEALEGGDNEVMIENRAFTKDGLDSAPAGIRRFLYGIVSNDYEEENGQEVSFESTSKDTLLPELNPVKSSYQKLAELLGNSYFSTVNTFQEMMNLLEKVSKENPNDSQLKDIIKALKQEQDKINKNTAEKGLDEQVAAQFANQFVKAFYKQVVNYYVSYVIKGNTEFVSPTDTKFTRLKQIITNSGKTTKLQRVMDILEKEFVNGTFENEFVKVVTVNQDGKVLNKLIINPNVLDAVLADIAYPTNRLELVKYNDFLVANQDAVRQKFSNVFKAIGINIEKNELFLNKKTLKDDVKQAHDILETMSKAIKEKVTQDMTANQVMNLINPFSNQYNYIKVLLGGVVKSNRLVDTNVSSGHRINGKTYQGHVVHNPLSLTLARLGLIGLTSDKSFIDSFNKDPFSRESQYVGKGDTKGIFEDFGYERGLGNFEGEGKELTQLEKREFRINSLNYILNKGSEFVLSFYDTLSDKSMMPVFKFKRQLVFENSGINPPIANPKISLNRNSVFLKYIRGEYAKAVHTRELFKKALESEDFSNLLEKNHYLKTKDGEYTLGLGGFFSVFPFFNQEHLQSIIDSVSNQKIKDAYTLALNTLYNENGDFKTLTDNDLENLLPVLNYEFNKLSKKVVEDFKENLVFNNNAKFENALGNVVTDNSINYILTGNPNINLMYVKSKDEQAVKAYNNLLKIVKENVRPDVTDKQLNQALFGLYNTSANLDSSSLDVFNFLLDRTHKAIAAEYQVQRAVASVEGYMMLGHPSDFSKAVLNNEGTIDLVTSINATVDELSKRNARLIASGDKGNFKTSTYNVAITEDTKIESPNFSHYEKLFKEASKNYKKGDEPDAQEFTTVKEHLDVSLAYGEIKEDEYLELMYLADPDEFKSIQSNYNPVQVNKIKAKIDKMSAKQKYKYMVSSPLQPRKPVQVTRYFDEKLGQFVTLYIKTSSVPLIPSMIKNNPVLNNLLVQMKRSNVQRVAFKSGVKNTTTTPVKVVNSDGSLPANLFPSSAIKTLDRADFSIQLNVPFKEDKKQIGEGTQYRTLSFVDIPDNLEINSPLSDKKYTAGELKTLFNAVHGKMFELKLKQLFEEFGYPPFNGILPIGSPKLYKIANLLKKEAEDSGYPNNIIKAFELDSTGTNFLIPIQFSPALPVIEPLLMSIVTNRLTKSKIKGKSLVQVSEFLSRFRGKTVLNASDLNKDELTQIIWVDPEKAIKNNFKLDFTSTEDGKEGTAEIIMPFYFQDGKGNRLPITDYMVDGKVDLTKIPQDLLYINGFRIPTQGANSVNTFKVVGFLPPSMGDAAVVPAEIAVQMGSDYDVDKLYTYFRNYKVTEEGNIELDETELDLNAIRTETDYDRLASLVPYINNLVNTGNDLVKNYMTAPLDGEELNNAIDLISNKNQVKRSVVPFDVTYQTGQYFNNRGGQTGVGITATGLTGHANAQNFNLYIDNPDLIVGFSITNDKGESSLIKEDESSSNAVTNTVKRPEYVGGFYRLDKVFSLNGNRISYLISQLLSAAVDNAKDKKLAAAGINNDNFDVILLLTRLGYEFDLSVPFINQPFLKNFLYPSLVKGDLYSNSLTSRANLSDFVENIFLTKDEKHPLKVYFNEQIQQRVDLGASKEQAVKVFVKELMDEVEFNSVEFLNGETNVLVKDANTNMYDFFDKNSAEESMKFIKRQIAVVNAYDKLKTISNDIRTLQSFTNVASKGLPISFSESSYKTFKINNILEYVKNLNAESVVKMSRTGVSKRSPLNVSGPSTVYSGAYAVAEFLYGNDNFFLNSSNAYVNLMKDYEKMYRGELSPELLSRLSSELVLYVAAKASTKVASKLQNILFEQLGVQHDLNNSVTVRTMLQQMKQNKETVKRNLLIDLLELKNDGESSALFLERAKSKSKDVSEKLSSNWKYMLESGTSEEKLFAALLVVETMKHSGRQTMGNSLYQLIPIDYIKNEINEVVKQEINFNSDFGLTEYGIEFAINNPENVPVNYNFNGYMKGLLSKNSKAKENNLTITESLLEALNVDDNSKLPPMIRYTYYKNNQERNKIFVKLGNEYVPYEAANTSHISFYSQSSVVVPIDPTKKQKEENLQPEEFVEILKQFETASSPEAKKAVLKKAALFAANYFKEENGLFAEFLSEMIDILDVDFSLADKTYSYRQGNKVVIGTKSNPLKIMEDFVHELSHLVIDDKVASSPELLAEAKELMVEYEKGLTDEEKFKANTFLVYKHLTENRRAGEILRELNSSTGKNLNMLSLINLINKSDTSENPLYSEFISLINKLGKEKSVSFNAVAHMVSNNLTREYRTLGAPLYNEKEFVAEFNGRPEVRQKARSIKTDKGSVYARFLESAFKVFKKLYTSIMGNTDNIDLEQRTNILLADVLKSYYPVSTSSNTINIYAGTGENTELSNFATRPFVISGLKYQTVEGYFQAQKLDYVSQEVDNNLTKQDFTTMTGAQAKASGKKIKGLIKYTWDEVSSDIMKQGILESFKQNPDALAKLLATDNATLTHTQDKGKWGTEFPRLLMEVRDELRNTYQEKPNESEQENSNTSVESNEREYTPENITKLKDNEVFVFGANTAGGHGGGTAGLAQRGTTSSNYTALPTGTKGKWSEYGIVDKLMQGTEGKSFGIVTKAATITGTSLKIGSKRSVPLSRIEESINALIKTANENPNLKFLVTKFGTNMAGFSVQEMKSLLENKTLPDNIILPKEFEVRQFSKPKEKNNNTELTKEENNQQQKPDVEIVNNSFTFPDGVTIDTGEIVLNEEQEKALIHLFNTLKVNKETGFLLQGYAGTGKTTIIKYYLAYLNATGNMYRNNAEDVLYSTASWASLKQLFKSVKSYFNNPRIVFGSRFKTIQSLEGTFKNIKFDADTFKKDFEKGTDVKVLESISKKFVGSLIIIDEVSFVSAKTLENIFTVAEVLGKQVIVMGDPGQIEGIGLKHNQLPFNFLERKGVAKSVLTKEMRQVDENPTLSVIRVFRDRLAQIVELERFKEITVKEFFNIVGENFLNRGFEKVINGKGVNFTDFENNTLSNFINKFFKSIEYKNNTSFAKVIAYTNERVAKYNERIRQSIFGNNVDDLVVGDVITGYDNKVIQEDGTYLFNNSEDYIIREVDYKEIELSSMKSFKIHTDFITNDLISFIVNSGLPSFDKSILDLPLNSKIGIFKVKLEENDNILGKEPVDLDFFYSPSNQTIHSSLEVFLNNYHNATMVIDLLYTAKNSYYSKGKHIGNSIFGKFSALVQEADNLIKEYDKLLLNFNVKKEIKLINGKKEVKFVKAKANESAIIMKGWDYGYAITTDKSQGSTYDNTFVDLDNLYGEKKARIIPQNNNVRDAVSTLKRLYVALSRVRSYSLIHNTQEIDTSKSVEDTLETSIKDFLSTLSSQERENFRLYLQQGLLTFSCQ